VPISPCVVILFCRVSSLSLPLSLSLFVSLCLSVLKDVWMTDGKECNVFSSSSVRWLLRLMTSDRYRSSDHLDHAPLPRYTSTHSFSTTILWKYVQMCSNITKIVATRCQILRPKCTKFDFSWAPPQTTLRELTALPQAL